MFLPLPRRALGRDARATINPAALRAPLLALLLLFLPGCRGNESLHSALEPDGLQAMRVFNLYQLFFWTCVVVWALVVLFTFGALYRRRGRAMEPPHETVAEPPDTHRDRPLSIAVNVAVVLTTLVLFGLLVADFSTNRKLHQFSSQPNAVHITLTGHQWWWEVRYDDEQPQNVFTDANEIHVPVGRPVKLVLQSADVIHSFWVPNLTGKKDLIPNHSSELWFQADKPGKYWGGCAEFCGHQHAKMRILVVADDEQTFNAWLNAARTPSRPPLGALAERGRDVFVRRQCSTCHTIVGTPARGRLGPDLTHVASRYTLAAGSIPNAPGHLAGWIIDPQRIKPGVRMPQNALDPHDLRALLEYLRQLK